jgi:hypothetical protein
MRVASQALVLERRDCECGVGWLGFGTVFWGVLLVAKILKGLRAIMRIFSEEPRRKMLELGEGWVWE